MIGLFLVALLGMPVEPAAALPTGEAVMQRVNDRDRGVDARLRLRFSLHDKKRGTFDRVVDVRRKRFGGSYRSIYHTRSPPHLRDVSMLIAEDTALDGMWMFFPESDHLVKVASRGISALASDFSCQDLRVTHSLGDFQYTTLGRTTIGGKPAFRVEMKPKRERLGREFGFTHAIGWVLESDWIIVRADFFDARGNVFKRFESEPPQLVEGVPTLMRYSMVNYRADHRSDVEVLTVEYRQELDEADFWPDALARLPETRAATASGRRP